MRVSLQRDVRLPAASLILVFLLACTAHNGWCAPPRNEVVGGDLFVGVFSMRTRKGNEWAEAMLVEQRGQSYVISAKKGDQWTDTTEMTPMSDEACRRMFGAEMGTQVTAFVFGGAGIAKVPVGFTYGPKNQRLTCETGYIVFTMQGGMVPARRMLPSVPDRSPVAKIATSQSTGTDASTAPAKGDVVVRAAEGGLAGEWVSTRGRDNTLTLSIDGKAGFNVVRRFTIMGEVQREPAHMRKAPRGHGDWEMTGNFGMPLDTFTYDASQRTLTSKSGLTYERAAATFLKGLKAEDVPDRDAAEKALSKLDHVDPDIEAFLPDLLEMSKDADPDLRARGLRVIAKGRYQSEEAERVQAVVKAGIADKVPAVVAAAASAAGRLGTAIEPLIPGLLECLKSENDEIVSKAAQAFGTSDVVRMPASSAAVPLLVEILKNPKNSSPGRRQLVALETLAMFGERAKPAVPTIVALLKSEDKGIRGYAVITLGGIGPAAAEAVPALTEMSKTDMSQMVRGSALEALKKIQVP